MKRTPQRSLTAGEKNLLRPIFGITLPYDKLVVAANDYEIGGRDNSFTPGYVANMAVPIWSVDYSVAPDPDKWVFIHEMTHVWQYLHGNSNIFSGIGVWWTYSNYQDAYPYDLAKSWNLYSYNFEQQASIVADYWYVSKGLPPQDNKGAIKDLAAYLVFIAQVQSSGPPMSMGSRDPNKEIGRYI